MCKIDSDHLLIWRKIFCFQKKSSVFKKKSSVFRRNLLVWREKNLLFSSKIFCFQEKIFCFQMISSGRSSDLGKFKVDRSVYGSGAGDYARKCALFIWQASRGVTLAGGRCLLVSTSCRTSRPWTSLSRYL